MPVILALDQGTTSSRALVFDAQGRVLGLAQRELTQHYPRAGWVEHDPAEIWNSQYDVACRALQNAGVQSTDVAAIGITNQRETAILWDRATSQPVAKAIVWQDRRTSDICRALRERGLADLVAARTGLVIDPYFSASKIAWLLDNTEGLRTRAERGEIAFGTVDSWLIWKLTGGALHVTDVTNASRTMLFDIHRVRWDPELCAALNVPAIVLPEVLPSVARFGTCEESLFGSAILIGGVAGDQQAALAGQAGFEAGRIKNTYGTGSFLMLNTGNRAVKSARGLLTTIALGWERGRTDYALEGSVFATGAAVQWLRDGLGIIEDASSAEPLAATVDDTDGVFFVPAFTGLGAPHWDPLARGTIVGITRGTTGAHIVRAALDAVAYQSAEVIEAMEQDSNITVRELRVDGGGSNNAISMQLQADLLGGTVIRPENTETTALGAAYLAGLQAGVWENVESIGRLWREGARFEPRMERERVQTLRAQWNRAVERSRNWAEG